MLAMKISFFLFFCLFLSVGFHQVFAGCGQADTEMRVSSSDLVRVAASNGTLTIMSLPHCACCVLRVCDPLFVHVRVSVSLSLCMCVCLRCCLQ